MARRAAERRDEAASAEGARLVREGKEEEARHLTQAREEARHEEARLREVAARAQHDVMLDTANGVATAQAHCLTLP